MVALWKIDDAPCFKEAMKKGSGRLFSLLYLKVFFLQLAD